MSSHQHQHPLDKIAGVEDDQGYRVGGFLPVHLGDVLGNSEGRYRVIHKLGNGVSATVWLAEELNNLDEAVGLWALKIFSAGLHVTEMSALVFLARMVAPHPNVLTFRGYFTVEGVNGSHICFVFPFLGPTVKQMQQANLDAAVKRGAAKQMADGLAHLHQAGFCHGHVADTAVLFRLRDADSWTKDQVYQTFGRPITVPVPVPCDNSSALPSSMPRYRVKAIDFKRFNPGLLSGDICIADFGQSFKIETDNPGMPPMKPTFLAPESLFK